MSQSLPSAAPCCPCDELTHPTRREIPAGLTALPRQPAGFPEYRLAMLRDLPTHPPLADWRAREGDDLGLMLLEMWAYVLDVIGFYDERIANESYLRTAVRRPSLRRLVELIGYRPRPALGASVFLGGIAEGKRPVVLPPRTGFRSGAFGDEPPQVFETEVQHTIHALKNEWELGPVRESALGDELILDPASAALAKGQLALLRWQAGSKKMLHAGRVTSAERFDALDGASYVRVSMQPPLPLDAAGDLAEVEVLKPTLNASPSMLDVEPIKSMTLYKISTPFALSQLQTGPTVRSLGLGATRTVLVLDAFYSQLAADAPVIVQNGTELVARTIVSVSRKNVKIPFPGAQESDETPSILASTIQIEPSLPLGTNWTEYPERLVIHFSMVDAGKPTRVAKTHLQASDFAVPGVPIEGLVEPFPESVKPPSELLLLDANDDGARVNGSVDVDARGNAAIRLAAATPPFDPALRTPISAFGNLVRATRGESVFNEVLGSGDSSQVFQSFTLKKKPLTYLNDPAAPDMRRSTLQVWVGGIEWKEVQSFFGVEPSAEVYIVRQDDEGVSTITFGNGETGLRLPSGIDNVVATYRFGAGAAKPPAGSISQLARPVEGLRRVVNPLAAIGGTDADRPQDLRRNAPTSALLLGRAVSLLDFEALAREFGVLNARVQWAWDETYQDAVAKVWFIADGGDVAEDLRASLIGQADPTTTLVATPALSIPSSLVIDLGVDPRFIPKRVSEDVRRLLLEPRTGLLALENIPIGQPLFRSRIFNAVLSVEGTCSVRAMTVDGAPAPFAIPVAEGWYRNFLDGLVINATKVASTEGRG